MAYHCITDEDVEEIRKIYNAAECRYNEAIALYIAHQALYARHKELGIEGAYDCIKRILCEELK